MGREEWTRSGQGKKTQRRCCGKTIEAERSKAGLRSDPIQFEDAVGVVWNKQPGQVANEKVRQRLAVVLRFFAIGIRTADFFDDLAIIVDGAVLAA